MLCYVRGRVIKHILCYKRDMLCYITHYMSCYITHHMLCYITNDMLCYIRHHMLCHRTHVMLCYISHDMLCYITHVMLALCQTVYKFQASSFEELSFFPRAGLLCLVKCDEGRFSGIVFTSSRKS